jgi:putative flavoprotein involved in K+ transport
MPDIVIIGAGAGGLALGHYLQRAGRDFQVIERGAIGQSWALMPADVRLLSPWWVNVLPGTHVPLARAFDKVSSGDYAGYLQRYAAERALPVEPHCEVTALARDRDGFTLQTSRGPLAARHVVCACGYFQNPYIPPFAGGDDGSVPVLHAAAYRGPAAVRAAWPQARRVLVVGRRITAGQIMVELHDAGYEVALAARGEVRMRAKWRRMRLKEELYFAYERLFTKLFPAVKAEERPIMDGGRTEDLLRDGRVRNIGGVRGIRSGSVEQLDGGRHPCDIVIFATGYRPALRFLDGLVTLDDAGLPRLAGMQSADVPGLWFLGLENQRNFLSPYLRGLAADARVLATALD